MRGDGFLDRWRIMRTNPSSSDATLARGWRKPLPESCERFVRRSVGPYRSRCVGCATHGSPAQPRLAGRQPVASDVCNARLHPASVLPRIRTHDLDIDGRISVGDRMPQDVLAGDAANSASFAVVHRGSPPAFRPSLIPDRLRPYARLRLWRQPDSALPGRGYSACQYLQGTHWQRPERVVADTRRGIPVRRSRHEPAACQ